MEKSTETKPTSWTRDKTPELTLFYNLAFDQLEKFIASEKNNNSADLNELPDSGFIKLKNYLWKDEENNKNSSHAIVTEEEKNIIKKLKEKEEAIRNFQSHIFHTDEALHFDEQLKNFILDLYDNAISSLGEIEGNLNKIEELHKRLNEMPDNKNHLKYFFKTKDNGNSYLTYEGKNFFLSLFLSKGDMKKFLKQRKGCKRDDSKDFKIKQDIYTFYCHSDGAIKYKFNQTEDFLENTDPQLAQEIRKKRQLYRINIHLNNVPGEAFDTELFPLFDEQSQKIATLPDLIHFCKKNKLFADLSFENDVEYNDKSVLISHDNFPDIKLRISMNTLHKLVLHQIRKNDINITDKIKSYGIERRHLKQLLNNEKLAKKLGKDKPQKLGNFLEEYENFRIRNNHNGIRQKIARWRTGLINGTNDSDIEKDITQKLPEIPVELNYRDFFTGKQKNIRENENFMTLAINYFADQLPEPGLYWQWQAFDGAGQEYTLFCNKNPKYTERTGNDLLNWRIKLTYDKQVLCKYLTLQERKDKTVVKNPEMPFLIGYKTMKNLLIAHLAEDKKLLGEAFFKRITRDIERLRKKENLELLDNNSIPYCFKIDHSAYDLKTQVNKRIDNLTEILENVKSNINTMSRNEKNRQIMRCYRLFSWKKRASNNVEMFLRKNEYQKMSKYHYLLEKKDDEYYKKILNSILNEIRQNNVIPRPIINLLDKSRDIDDLLIKTIKRTQKLLKKWKNNTDNDIKGTARKLGVPIYEKQENNNRHVPFAIHPGLVIQAMYEKELKTNENFSLSRKIWNDPYYTEPLIASHYNYDSYFHFFGGKEEYKKQHKKQFRNIIGAINERKTSDALLFQIAKKYDRNYSGIRDMHKENIKIPVDSQNVKVFAKYKQLNSFLLINDKSDIEKIINYMDLQDKIFPGENEFFIDDIKAERDRIYHKSLLAIEALLNWERNIVKTSSIDEPFPHLSFNNIINKAGNPDNAAQLKEYRNTSFHSEIPRAWTYENIHKDPQIGKKFRELTREKEEKKEKYKT